MAADHDDMMDGFEGDTSFRYLIVRPENGGILDLFRWSLFPSAGCSTKFLEYGGGREDDSFGVAEPPAATADPEDDDDNRWVIIVSILMRKVLGFARKPMEWIGFIFEFFLNILSLNGGNLLVLFFNFLSGKVVMPHRGSETFISAIGHLDGRIDLDKDDLFKQGRHAVASSQGRGSIQMDLGNRALMDLCMMAAKLAYENANVVSNVVTHHWKMHYVDFYNCWNDYQKERSTQVFIMCNKPKDANLILISFRGTEPFDADDWITDFDYSWYEFPKLGKVHMGFLEALGLGSRADTSTFQKIVMMKKSRSPWESESLDAANVEKKLNLEMGENTAYFTVKNKLKELLDEHKNAKFIVTGHSLGGALAILFPTVLVIEEEKEVMERLLGIQTFGQPRIGNRQLGIFMEAHLEYPDPKYLRVVYCNDLVPRLPYDDRTWLYKHFGVCLYFNSLYIEQKVEEEPNKNYFGLKYLVREYVNAGWELIRSLIMGYMYGPEYKEEWLPIILNIFGLVLPGVSAHSPRNYVNSIRLGRIDQR